MDGNRNIKASKEIKALHEAVELLHSSRVTAIRKHFLILTAVTRANMPASAGAGEGAGVNVGVGVGATVGGASVGLREGLRVGEAVGERVGFIVGGAVSQCVAPSWFANLWK